MSASAIKPRSESLVGHPIFDAFNPIGRQFMQARWLPAALNPFKEKYDIEIAALVSFGVFAHIKVVPAIGMMVEDFDHGVYVNKHTLVVDSSGNTAHAAARAAPAFGFKHVKVVLSVDVPESKVGILDALSSVRIIKVPGNESVAGCAVEEAQRPGHYHLNQYAHHGNPRAHAKFTMPEVRRLLGPRGSVVAVSMGSTGTALGLTRAFGNKMRVVGVMPARGEQVPGARDLSRIKSVVTFPWEEEIREVVEVGRKGSFYASRALWEAVEPQPGPTSGLAYLGLGLYLERLGHDELEKLRGTRMGFICPDDGRFYSERVTGELDPDQGLNSAGSFTKLAAL